VKNQGKSFKKTVQEFKKKFKEVKRALEHLDPTKNAKFYKIRKG